MPSRSPSLNIGRLKYGVSQYRSIRVDWETEQVAASHTDTAGDWHPLTALEPPAP